MGKEFFTIVKYEEIMPSHLAYKNPIQFKVLLAQRTCSKLDQKIMCKCIIPTIKLLAWAIKDITTENIYVYAYILNNIDLLLLKY